MTSLRILIFFWPIPRNRFVVTKFFFRVGVRVGVLALRPLFIVIENDFLKEKISFDWLPRLLFLFFFFNVSLFLLAYIRIRDWNIFISILRRRTTSIIFLFKHNAHLRLFSWSLRSSIILWYDFGSTLPAFDSFIWSWRNRIFWPCTAASEKSSEKSKFWSLMFWVIFPIKVIICRVFSIFNWAKLFNPGWCCHFRFAKINTMILVRVLKLYFKH